MAPATQEKVCCDGNEAAAWCAYACSDAAVIYPITPSSGMGELADAWSGANQMNIFGQATKVVMMQSEAGAVGAVHGSLTAGALTTTFTASQGLLLMIPNMYKIAGELLPCVFHVAARALASQALSIFGDHGDVMAVRQTGFSMLSSHSVQEAHDMALVAHIAALESSLPFVHFFDGFRTSHELDDIQRLDYNTIKGLINLDLVKKFKDRAVNPEHPDLRGTSQAPDIFFQMNEASNTLYNQVPAIVKRALAKVSEVTGRVYHTFDYTGAADAENVVVVMGSGALTVEEVVEYLVAKQGAKIGVLKVHLYRPWVAEDFLAAMPKTVKRIAVLDRTKEPGCLFEPLALDVMATIQQAKLPTMVISGRYGLGSKDFTAGMVKAIYDNLAAPSPKTLFTIGIHDDVTHLSLPWNEDLNTVPEGTIECMFWGMGADGTVGANRNSIKVITDHTDLHTQAYFVFDAHKSGGVTVSHLRFGPKPINSIYLLQHANFIAVHHDTYPEKYGARLVKQLRKGGIVLLNTKLTPEEVQTKLPGDLRKAIAEKEGKLYIIDALHECEKLGLGKHINILMQVCFFHLSKVIPDSVYISALKDAIKKSYYKKGEAVVAKNQMAVDHAISALNEVKYNAADWMKATKPAKKEIAHAPAKTDFIKNILDPMIDLDGDDLPVSVFTPGGVFPMGTTKYEKRGLAFQVPHWDSAPCIQCNKCASVCPHACIRPVLATQEEIDAAPFSERISSLKAQGREAAGFRFRIQVSPLDCTGCKVCTEVCPADCLSMTDLTNEIREKESPIWNYFMNLPERGQAFDRFTIKGSQFRQPLLEFSGACDGCGETAYVKLITQLFGERMILANATGCSSIWGGTVGTNPYTVRNDNGRGVGWANSLFEDNAEYGYGMVQAYKQRRDLMKVHMTEAIKAGAATPEMKVVFEQWMNNMDNAEICEEVRTKLTPLMKNVKAPELVRIAERMDMIIKPSQWIIGGDGWAYDIGYGGLDHVLHQGEKVNIMVLDTEMYSNTGGQMSKSTPMGAVVKFAAAGKRTMKKDLGKIAMANEQCYVAQIAIEADVNQALKAIQEAEAYPGTSIIIAYAPCIAHGMENMNKGIEVSKAAVDSGYWPLFRFNPSLIAKGENPLSLDSGRLKADVATFIAAQNRFTHLQRTLPDIAHDLNAHLIKFAVEKFNKIKTQSKGLAVADLKAGLAGGKRGEDSLVVLYISETGNAAGVANRFAAEGRARGMTVEVFPANDFAFDDLQNVNRLIVVGSTCGQGEVPENGKAFLKDISAASVANDYLAGVKFAVFGLGDSAYLQFNLTAKLVDEALAAKGATRMMPIGLGDDQDADRFETKLEEWEPEFWDLTGKKRLKDGPAEPVFKVATSKASNTVLPKYVPSDATLLPLTKKVRMTPVDHDREICHYEIDLAGSNFKYGLCDAIAIWGESDPKSVDDMIDMFNLDKETRVHIDCLEGADKKAAKELPKETTVYTLFTEILDITGRPNRRFYNNLSFYADEKDKKAIADILNDKAKFRAMVDKELVNYVDLFKRFPSVRPSLDRLIELIPIIRPRLYSCASSPRMHPTKAELCIVTVDWVPEKDGVKMPVRKGLCTGYLGRVQQGDALKIGLRPSAMIMPEDAGTPVAMSALGTGLAPFRAMIQERAALKRAGRHVGELCLYYGCRYKAKEYLYGDEFDAYEKEGVLTRLRPAFSRDQAKKVYINDKIREDGEYMYKNMVEKKGSFFYCGSAGETPKGIRNSIKEGFVTVAKIAPEQAEQAIKDMETSGRYIVEAW